MDIGFCCRHQIANLCLLAANAALDAVDMYRHKFTFRSQYANIGIESDAVLQFNNNATARTLTRVPNRQKASLETGIPGIGIHSAASQSIAPAVTLGSHLQPAICSVL